MLVVWISILALAVAGVMAAAGGLVGGIVLVPLIALALACLIYLGGVLDQSWD